MLVAEQVPSTMKVTPTWGSHPKDLMLLVYGGVLFVLLVFVVLALVRYWSYRLQHPRKATRGLDLEGLRRQRDAGAITQEEYEAVRAQIVAAGAAEHRHVSRADATKAGDNSAEHPINHRGDREGTPEGRKPDGQE
jgi:hypothetical protein